MNNKFLLCVSALAFVASSAAFADKKGSNSADQDHHRGEGRAESSCPVSQAALETAIKNAQAKANGGLGFHMWASVVNNKGVVCAVAKSGTGLNDQWLGSRVISAQKAYTANAFSLSNGLALSTANLYSAVQPGGSLYGLQFSNPVDTNWAYAGNSVKFGRADDPMTGRRVGGVNVFGGGLAMYNASGVLVGAVGVSGDTSCADHNIAWRVRDELKFDYVPNGVGALYGGTVGDNIIFDVVNGVSASGFGHAACSANVALDKAANGIVVGEAPLN